MKLPPTLNALVAKLAALILATTVTIAAAQTAPSADQIRQLNAMPELQKRALARQFGIDLPSSMNSPAAAPPIQPSQNEVLVPVVTPAQVADTKGSDPEIEPSVPTEEPVADRVKLRRFPDLQPFGYNLFASQPSTFAPVGVIPVPQNYVLGPGDQLLVSLFGQQQSEYAVNLGADGFANIPDVGRINLAGQSFDDARERIRQEIEQSQIGVQASVTLGELRSIQVFVLGDVAQPGSFAVSPYSTVLNALFVAGGIQNNGTLRAIQLKRDNQVVATLDLYALLLQGDVSSDLRVQSGDVIFVPSVGPQVAITGEVKRPAVFEIKPGERVSDVVGFASGLSGYAFENEVRIRRTEQGQTRTSQSYQADQLVEIRPQAGDEIEVLPVNRIIENAVQLAGLVERPGLVQWRTGMSLKSVIETAGLSRLAGELLAVVERINPSNQALDVLMVRIPEVLKGSAGDQQLQPRDRITLVPVVKDYQGDFSRAGFFSGLAQRIENSTPIGQRPNLIRIDGVAEAPGPYPLVSGMDAAEILSLADLKGEPSGLLTVLERRGPKNSIEVSVMRVSDLLTGQSKLALAPGDRMSVIPAGARVDQSAVMQTDEIDRAAFFAGLANRIRTATPINQVPPLVSVEGSVRLPGIYPLPSNGEINGLLLLAGGFLPDADRNLVEVIRRNSVGFDIARVSSRDFSSANQVTAGSQLVVRNDREQKNLTEVSVSGYVRFPGSYRMPEGSTLSDLVQRAGGLLPEADLGAAIFTREQLRQREQRQLQQFEQQTREALVQQSLSNRAVGEDGASETNLEAIEAVVDNLTSVSPVGRLVINLPAVLAGQIEQDVLLETGDALIVPSVQQSVSVMGQVLFPTSHMHERGLGAQEYIARSGGLSAYSDKKRAFVIRANGLVEPIGRTGWLAGLREGVAIEPGDTIVIPQEVDRVSRLSLWSAITGIAYQTAVAISVVNTL